jgi:hypothetical protein
MNVIRIYGGLGNQLFQYAFGRVMESNGIEVRYDLTYRVKIHADEDSRPYRLNKFNTDVKISSFLNQRTIREKEFSPLYTKLDNCNFWGYWQYINIYKDVLPILRKEFCVKEEFYIPEFITLKNQILNTNSVGIHVRRGDYVKNNAFNVLPLSYYQNALRYVKGDILVFSDDIKWCQKYFTGRRFQNVMFIKGGDYFDFELLKSCKQKIIANSTFSAWAALLNEDSNSVVVAPKQWRTKEENQVKFMKEFCLPKEWKLL